MYSNEAFLGAYETYFVASGVGMLAASAINATIATRAFAQSKGRGEAKTGFA